MSIVRVRFDLDENGYSEGMTCENVGAVQNLTILEPNFEIVPHHIDGHLIAQRKSDGYVNATAMCRAAGKLLANYTRNAGTQEFLETLAADMRISISELLLVRKGGKPHEQGTWIHPDAAVHFGQWLSPKFAVQVSKWVRDWMATGQPPVFKLPRTFAESLRLLADATEACDRLQLKNTELLTNNEELTAVTEELKDTVQVAQAELVTQTRTAEALMAKIEIPKTDTSLTDFFSINYELLGYSSITGFELLRDIGFIKWNGFGRCRQHASRATPCLQQAAGSCTTSP